MQKSINAPQPSATVIYEPLAPQHISRPITQYHTDVLPIAPQPTVQSYESSDESENEDRTAAESLPSATAGELGAGNVLVTVMWIGGAMGVF